MFRLIILAVLLMNLNMLYASSIEYGKASWYSTKCNHGTQTASGKKLVNNANVVAHKTLPMGTQVKITNLKNKKTIDCIVIDRGPHIKGRIVDVTIGVAERLGFKKQGLTTVKVEVVGKIDLKTLRKSK